MRRFCLSVLLFAAFTANTLADRIIVPHTPRQYVVQAGDTLWGIATHFFRDPWQWPGIWNRNRQIHNPDLIYPGDTIALRYAKGRPYLVDLGPAQVAGTGGTVGAAGARAGGETSSAGTVVLRPSMRSEPLHEAIPTLNPNVIGPFLQRPLALSRRELGRMGYIAASVHRHTFLASFGRFYARHLGPHPAKVYDIYRRGPALHNQDGSFLAYETKYIGRAKLVRAGRMPEFEVLSSVREVEAGDRLIPWHATPPIPHYYPRAPHKLLKGDVVAATRNAISLGTYAVLAINIGKNKGVRRGYVLKIYSRPRHFYDSVAKETVRGRSQPIGLLMIFRTFAKVSYGIVMQARREIHVGDWVATP